VALCILTVKIDRPITSITKDFQKKKKKKKKKAGQVLVRAGQVLVRTGQVLVRAGQATGNDGLSLTYQISIQ